MATFDIQDILETLPHRYPFILIDKITEFVPRQTITAVKNVTINEPFFQGHFPDKPTMPGVLMLEAMAQSLAMLALQTLKSEGVCTKEALFFYAGVDKARFRRPIVPGDIMVIKVDLIKVKGPILKAKATVTVDGNLACEAEIMAYNTVNPTKENKETKEDSIDS